MLSAFVLALGQLTDRNVLRILAKCIAITLALFVALGAAGWWCVSTLLAAVGLHDGSFAAAGELRGVAAAFLVLAGGWLLWRIIAVAVLQFHADEVVQAIERRHYPEALANARAIGWRGELANGLRGAIRAAGYNLLALPVALALLVTGVGTALVFLLVNAVLLGWELTELVWLRHRRRPDAPAPLARSERLVLGGVTAVLFTLPVANLLAPVIGAAMATHLIHRKGTVRAS